MMGITSSEVIGMCQTCGKPITDNSDYEEVGHDLICEECVDRLCEPRPASSDLDSMGRYRATGAERVTRRSAPSGVMQSKTVGK